MKTRMLTLGALATLFAASACDLFYLPPPEVDYANQPAPPTAVEMPERVPEVVVDDDGYAYLTGQVKNWVSLEYVSDASLQTYGLANTVTGTADGNAAFQLEVDVAGDDGDAAALAERLVGSGIQLVRFQEIEPNLEDLFMTVTKGEVQ